MKRLLSAVLLLAPAFALAQGKAVIATDKIDAVVTVTAVDQKARTVTMRGPRGNLQTLQVPEEAQNLDKVKAGDRFKITYAEAAVVAVSRGGAPAAGVDQTVQLAPKGGTPGGKAVRTHMLAVVIDAIDYTGRYVSVRGPRGNRLAMPVSQEVKDFDKLMVGDKVTIVFTQALALEMLPVEKPKKAAAKKS